MMQTKSGFKSGAFQQNEFLQTDARPLGDLFALLLEWTLESDRLHAEQPNNATEEAKREK